MSENRGTIKLEIHKYASVTQFGDADRQAGNFNGLVGAGRHGRNGIVETIWAGNVERHRGRLRTGRQFADEADL